LEALAAELPMLVTSVGGIPEMLPERSLVAAGDAKALADAIREALSHPGRVRQLAKDSARQVAKQFSAALMVKQICRFYQSLTLA
jgi:glycosyltransferase involved in cell wall biosynthesis